ncbi:MAG TPA: hypothetical protein VG758_05375 [Hyphomicrobiaceae bacterium]|nr:hypothetical protein [Hyphomicrobiaceae bacterium]
MSALTDGVAAGTIHDVGIDMLIDLMGYTAIWGSSVDSRIPR